MSNMSNMSFHCYSCPVPSDPFSPRMCTACARKYCAQPGNLCGQSCQGCRALVFAEDNQTQRPPIQPKKPHRLCGCMHNLGTPCPSIPVFSRSQPKKPHSRCGCMHELGTPCPIPL
jgi:hypothetical protein